MPPAWLRRDSEENDGKEPQAVHALDFGRAKLPLQISKSDRLISVKTAAERAPRSAIAAHSGARQFDRPVGRRI